jgi:hypothetical protein
VSDKTLKIAFTFHSQIGSKSNVLDEVALLTEHNQTIESLQFIFIVVVPYFVTIERVE